MIINQYIDRFMGPIMKIIQKFYRDHLNSIGSVEQLVSSQEGANVIQVIDLVNWIKMNQVNNILPNQIPTMK